MAVYSFKSVGLTPSESLASQTEAAPIPIGIKTPLQIGGSDGLLMMNYDLAAVAADNLLNLIQTNWGERLGHYRFGANLKPLTVNFSSQDGFDAEAMTRIKQAVSTWMPYVELEDFSSEVDRLENQNTGIIRVNVGYSVPVLNATGKKIQAVLYVI